MEHEILTEEFLEKLRRPYNHGASEPLFEEAAEEAEEKCPSLEDRVDTMEYRLGRALLCLNQCQKELVGLRKGQKELLEEQSVSRIRQERHRKAMKYGTCTVLGVIFAAQVKDLAALGWQVVDHAAQLLGVDPELVSGVLLSFVILCLAAKLGCTLARKLINRQGKERDEDAVCDR